MAIVNSLPRPFYVDNEAVSFNQPQHKLSLKIVSEWKTVEECMLAKTNNLVLYFPTTVELDFDKDVENRLVQDMREWPFFSSLPPKWAEMALDLARLASYRSALDYERKLLHHRHLVWNFVMDEVSERLPLFGLHDTMGRVYLDNLKNIVEGQPIKDLMQFETCPTELLQMGILAQHMLVDVMLLQRRLLSPKHLSICISALHDYFDIQYVEALKFDKETSSEDIIATRTITVGFILPLLICMESAEVEMYRRDDPVYAQLAILTMVTNDVIGLARDLAALERKEDGSVKMNIVRAVMRDLGLSLEDALRLYAEKMNHLNKSFEFFLAAYTPEQRQCYVEGLRLVVATMDWHFVVTDGKVNPRYEWHLSQL